MELPNGTGMKGVILWEALLWLVVYGVLLGGTHLALGKYWNVELKRLQKERLTYDGVPQWMEIVP